MLYYVQLIPFMDDVGGDFMRRILTFALIIVGIFALAYYQMTTSTISSHNDTSNIIYVNPSNDTSGDGSSWLEAFITVEEALEVADANHQIWVVSDVECLNGTNIYVKTINGVSVYLGFNVNEDSLDDRVLEDCTSITLEHLN